MAVIFVHRSTLGLWRQQEFIWPAWLPHLQYKTYNNLKLFYHHLSRLLLIVEHYFVDITRAPTCLIFPIFQLILTKNYFFNQYKLFPLLKMSSEVYNLQFFFIRYIGELGVAQTARLKLLVNSVLQQNIYYTHSKPLIQHNTKYACLPV